MTKPADNFEKNNDCEVVTIGEPFENVKSAFRETCFGITKIGNEYLFTRKNDELSMVGGGVEVGEAHAETLTREYLEESGFKVKAVKHFVDVDAYWMVGHGTYPMRSLAHIYLVDCKDTHGDPTEENHKPVLISLTKAYNELQLLYHKKAIKHYLNSLK